MTARPKLRFGIMCRNPRRFPAWEAECIRRIVASGHAEPALLIHDVTPQPPPVPWSARTALHRLWDERWVRPRLASLRPVDLAAELAGVETIDCAVATRGAYSQHFADADVAAIRARSLDFILRFGFNIIRGEILHAARYGVWSYHHDDERLYRGGPPGFWEIANGDRTTGAILQKLTDRLDGGVVLHRGVFGTCGGSWTHNIDRAFFGSADWCARVCAELATGKTQRITGAPSPTTAAIRRAPTSAEVARCWARMGAHVARKLAELLFHVEVWNVGVTGSDQGVERILRDGALDAHAITWCPPHARGHFIADPFAYIDDTGAPRLLVEDYDHAGKGRICELRPPGPGGGRRLELTAALETEHHLSYPCLFPDDIHGALYCVPESYQANGALLYRREGGAWRFVRRLLHGLPVVDPTLFRHDGRYWLLFTLQDDGAYGNLKLHGYHAESLDGVWRPHALNPLKCDITSARPAGAPFVAGGQLHRPSMDCAATYGAAVVINRVDRLSPTEFDESAVARIAPAPDGPYPAGLHTLNRMGAAAVVDGKRFAFDLLAWRHNWRRLHEVFG
jgi:hypothetical protein